MEEAATLLESDDKPISEVAARVGHRLRQHFRGSFIDITVCRPARYRAARKQGYASSSSRPALRKPATERLMERTYAGDS